MRPRQGSRPPRGYGQRFYESVEELAREYPPKVVEAYGRRYLAWPADLVSNLYPSPAKESETRPRY